jgi:hypothetical protein
MTPKEVLEVAGLELDRLTEQLIGSDSAAAQPLAKIEALTERIVSLRQDLSSVAPTELEAAFEDVLRKAKRVQTLLQAGTVFHCQAIFGRTETPDAYSFDGTFSTNHGSGMIFQG